MTGMHWIRRFDQVRFGLGVWLVWILVTAGLFGLAQWVHGGIWSPAAEFTRWDGAWYLSVVQYGYAGGSIHGQTNIAFFPLYPLLVSVLQHGLFIPMVAAAVSVSVMCFGGALLLFYDLVRRQYDEHTAQWATLLLAFNPFGLFFAFAYTESLYLLLSVAVFWLLARRGFWWAAVVAGIAAGSRPQGVILALFVVAGWLWQNRAALRRPARRMTSVALQAVALGLVSTGGLALFAAYLQVHNHDALAFVHVQVYWGRVGVSNLWPALWGFAEGVRHHTIPHPILFSDVVWYGAIVAGVAGGALLVWQREYWYAAYVLLGLAIPLASGSIEGMDRYVMVLFPLYVAVARALQLRWERRLALMASVCTFAVFWLIYLDPRQLFFG